MPINSTIDVVVQQDDLIVLGPPSALDVSVDIGPKGDRGSTFFTGSGDPNTLSLSEFATLHGQVPVFGDIYLRIDFGEDYGKFYSYTAVPGGVQWAPVIDLLQTMELFFQYNSQAASSYWTAVGASAIYGSASAVPQLRFDLDKRLSQVTNIPISISSSQVYDFNSSLSGLFSDKITSNIENGINVTYNQESDKINFDVNDFTITLEGDVEGAVTITNLANAVLSASVVNNSHSHTSTNISDFDEAVQDVVGAMVSNNAEAGIVVTYDDNAGNLNFDVNNFDIILYGDVTGQATVVDLGTVAINATVQNDSHSHTLSTITNIQETLEDVIGQMVETNTENGIVVSYVDNGPTGRGKLNFDVNDFTLTFGGDVAGSALISNLANTSISLSVIDDSHNHTISTITNFVEQSQDAAAALFNHNFHTNISVNYDDANNRILLVAQSGGGGGGEGGSAEVNNAYWLWFGI